MSESPPSTPLLSDRAADRDLLEFMPYTETLLEIIRDRTTEGPLVIGLFGTWGSGKTSLMKFVQHELAEPAQATTTKFRAIWFDAWKYEKEEALWRALLLRVVDGLRSRDAAGKDTTAEALRRDIEQLEQRLYRDVEWEEKGGLKIDWPQAAKSAVKGAIQLSVGFIPGVKMLEEALKAASGELGKGEELGNLVGAFRRDVVEHHQAQLRSIEQFQAEFGRLVENHVLNHGQRLVVFVDDLDRCLPEKAIEVLEAIKLFLDVRGCIFLLGLDQDVVTRGIKVKYRGFALEGGAESEKHIPIDGAAYLEKIIQLPFRLPKIEQSKMKSFIHALTAFADKRCEEVFAVGLKTNPRKVKRAINIFLFISGLARRRVIAIKPVRLAKVVVIYHSHPELYELLSNKPALLRDLGNYLHAQRRREAGRSAKGEITEAGAAPAQEPAPVPAHLLQADLTQVLTLFMDAKDAEARDACFHDAEFDEIQSYFTLTRGTIAAAPAATEAPAATRLAFAAPTFVRIPAGEFRMGTSDEDIEQLVKTTKWAKEWKQKDYFKREQPQHLVTLEDYRIGKYPVTNAEYAAYVKDKEAKSPPPSHWSGGELPEALAAHPVVNVSWDDASQYCEWLTRKLREAGQLKQSEEIRLPTEAQWEKAARGAEDTRFYPWGNQWDLAKCNSSESGVGSTTPVGKYSPAGDSPFGVADMAGNVWQWCADWFSEDYYQNSPKENPPGADKGDFRVLRGGSFDHDPDRLRCGDRVSNHPGGRNYNFGFRVVCVDASAR
jgi:formylglycine-generating enzyme required for sulfatase activity